MLGMALLIVGMRKGCRFGAEVNKARESGALRLQVGLLTSKWPGALREGSGVFWGWEVVGFIGLLAEENCVKISSRLHGRCRRRR